MAERPGGGNIEPDSDSWTHAGLIVNGFFLLAHQPRIDIPRSPALRDIAGHIAEGACLLAGRTLIRRRLCRKGIVAIGTFPLSH